MPLEKNVCSCHVQLVLATAYSLNSQECYSLSSLNWQHIHCLRLPMKLATEGDFSLPHSLALFSQVPLLLERWHPMCLTAFPFAKVHMEASNTKAWLLLPSAETLSIINLLHTPGRMTRLRVPCITDSHHSHLSAYPFAEDIIDLFFLIRILVCPLGELQEIYLYPSIFTGSTVGGGSLCSFSLEK